MIHIYILFHSVSYFNTCFGVTMKINQLFFPSLLCHTCNRLTVGHYACWKTGQLHSSVHPTACQSLLSPTSSKRGKAMWASCCTGRMRLTDRKRKTRLKLESLCSCPSSRKLKHLRSILWFGMEKGLFVILLFLSWSDALQLSVFSWS